MNFAESIAHLYSLGNEVSAMKLGLENIGKLLKALNKPQKKYLKIQVAGTNGKGSTCAFLEAICVSAGVKVGMTTSPHLVSVTERVKINGREISEKDFARHATIIRNASETLVEIGELETVPTFFEQVTAIALNAFAEAKVELAILETGLGGRFDATTAAKAEIVGITPIALDHQRILGDTLAKIAAEKAAIIREDTDIIVAKQPAAARKVIVERCAELGISKQLLRNIQSKIIIDHQTYSRRRRSKSIFSTVTIKTGKSEYQNVRLSLPGSHQKENAKLAFHLAEILQEKGFVISDENFIKGLQTAKHKGRLEFYKNYLFDGAHNVAGAEALRNFLDEFVEKPVTMIFAAMRDKDLAKIAEILFPKADKIIFTTPENSRSAKAKELLKFLPKDFDKRKVYTTENVAEALKTAQNISAENDLICVTGSLYLIGEAQKILKNQSEI